MVIKTINNWTATFLSISDQLPCNMFITVHEIGGLYLYFFVYLCRCYLQKRVLNRSKGPAVWALRAQTDKREYGMEMKKVVERFAPAA